VAGGGRRRFGSSVLLLVAAITVLSPNSPAKAAFAGGTGTSGDPYQIADCTQLAEIDDTTANLSKAFILTQNISCSGSFTPLINGTTYFSGSFNGNGKTISGLSITCSTINCGLFARVTTNASFQNLTIQSPSVSSSTGCVGALFGLGAGVTTTNVDVVGGTISGAESTDGACLGSNVGGLGGYLASGHISGSDVSATISSSGTQVGGVIGWMFGNSSCSSSNSRISNSTNSGSVSGTSDTGGLVGEFYRSGNDGTCGIFDSSNSGPVTGSGTCSNVGGVAGSVTGGTISNVSNTATVTAGTCPSTGGLIGQLRGGTASSNASLTRSWNSGTVNGRWYVGGIVGYCDADYPRISLSFNIGAISTSSSQVGGLIGVSDCMVSDSFSRASISSTSPSRMGGAFGEGLNSVIGTESTRVYSASSSYGFFGYNSGSFDCSASFWDTTLKSTSPASCGVGLVGKSTSEMKTQSTFTDAGWDFVGESSNGTNDYWGIDPLINAGYPYLIGVGVLAITSDTTAPSTPGTPDLVAGSDSGQSSTDNVTNDNTPDISVTAAEAGGTVTVTATKGGSSNVTCTMTGSTSGGTCTLGTLAEGTWTVTAAHADSSSNTSAASASLSITIDTTAPTRSSFTPTSGATGVVITESPTITFNDTVIAGSGNITIYSDASCSTTFATIAGNNAQVTISGSTVTINPTSDFAVGTTYCITYAASAFSDTAGNQVTALSSTATFTFSTIADTTAPSAPGTPDLVAGSDSGQSSTDNVTNDNTPDISVTAAEAGGTVTVTATKGGSSNVTCTMTGSTSGGTCTLGTLANGTWTVTATHADSSSNTSAASASLSITIDTTAPTASYNPNSSVGNSRRRVMTMSMNEAVYAGSGTLRLYTNPSTLVESFATSAVTISGTSVTITPTVLMAANTQHYVLIDAGFVTDLAGNNFAAVNSNSTWNYVTDSDATAPTATLTSPTSPTSSRTLSYSLTFSESVTGLADSDFSITGTATSCSASVSAAAGTNFTVTVTCSSNGTVDLELSMNTVRDQVGIDGPTTSVSATQVTINATSTAAVPPAAPTTSTTSTTTAPTVRTLSIVGAASRYVVTQDGPGLTAVPSAGGGAISWSSLTPSVCTVSTIAMMSILSAQSSVEVGRLNVVGTCTISATVAATTTHSSASTSVTFTVTRARPVVMVSVHDDHFYAKITLPREISSSTSLLRTMYDSLRFLVVSENCEIDIIATYSESESEFGSSWIGLHGRPVFTESGTCNVRADLPSADRWFATTSPLTAALARTTASATSTNPPTTLASSSTTVPSASTSLPTSTSTSEPESSSPSITSFGPTSTATRAPIIELDVEKQIVLESGETEIVFTRESLIKTAENLGVQVGAIRVRTASSAWAETSLPDATDLRLIIRQTDVELNVEVAPETGEVIRISVPIVVNVEQGFELGILTIAFLAGAVVMAWLLFVLKRRRQNQESDPRLQ